MKNVIRDINGVYNNSKYYGHTDCLYIEKKYRDVLDKAKLDADELCQGKNE